MWDRYDPREDNGDRRSASDRSLGGRGCTRDRDRNEERDQSDVFTRTLDLPRGPNREQVRDRDRVYELDGAESRMLATVGTFRVVAEHDLHAMGDDARPPRQSIRHLEDEGLIRRSALSTDDRAVTLPERGRDLLEANRYEGHDRSRHEDLEVVTAHYRGAHAGAAAKSGFTCYLSIGCSVGGRGGGGRRTAHPRIAEELLR